MVGIDPFDRCTALLMLGLQEADPDDYKHYLIEKRLSFCRYQNC